MPSHVYQIKQIWVIYTNLQLYLATANHKWVKILPTLHRIFKKIEQSCSQETSVFLIFWQVSDLVWIRMKSTSPQMMDIMNFIHIRHLNLFHS